jgi:hypothetical protein
MKIKTSTKNIVLILFISVFLLIVTNVVSYYIIKAKFRISMYDLKQYSELKAQYIKDEKQGQFPHPFYGSAVSYWKTGEAFGTNEPLFDSISSPERADSVRVLILGGSVARQLSNFPGSGTNIFAEVLKERLNTDRFVVYNGSIGGGKQPQQYFKYLYLDLLNFIPDIVINFDGPNEIMLPLAENIRSKIPAIYPRSYSGLIRASSGDRSCAKLNNRLLRLDSNIPLLELGFWLFVRYCHKTIDGDTNSVPWWSWIDSQQTIESLADESVTVWRESSNI